MKIFALIFLCVILSIFAVTSMANSSLEFAYGVVPAKESGSNQGDSWRLSYSHDLTMLDDFLKPYNIGLRLETSVQRWDDVGHQANHVVSLNPVFHYLWHFEPMSIFIELGIGAAYVENSIYLDRNLGSHWLFEDKLGLGVVIKRNHKIGLFFMHYSNADLASHNDGADSIGLSYGYIW
ncbi:acyloxyacyl hydrolase [Shewanella halifaxensis]|uniref:acyloxyacyl hydrolase n=1 Tax=Shewanella halifaxensis TaxID=271098 RepID=UPI0013A64EB8|nr:acyloxyacyl hydrolase [Shewanella halifaxensis]